MTWQDDPYEWIDPEKGRQGGVLTPSAEPTIVGRHILIGMLFGRLVGQLGWRKADVVRYLGRFDVAKVRLIPHDKLDAAEQGLRAFLAGSPGE